MPPWFDREEQYLAARAPGLPLQPMPIHPDVKVSRAPAKADECRVCGGPIRERETSRRIHVWHNEAIIAEAQAERIKREDPEHFAACSGGQGVICADCIDHFRQLNRISRQQPREPCVARRRRADVAHRHSDGALAPDDREAAARASHRGVQQPAVEHHVVRGQQG